VALIDPTEPCPCGSGLTYARCHLPRVREQKPPAITERCQLAVISEPDPDTRPVHILTGAGTILIQGFACGLSMDCGKCGASLIVGLKREQVQGIVLKCNACGTFNNT